MGSFGHFCVFSESWAPPAGATRLSNPSRRSAANVSAQAPPRGADLLRTIPCAAPSCLLPGYNNRPRVSPAGERQVIDKGRVEVTIGEGTKGGNSPLLASLCLPLGTLRSQLEGRRAAARRCKLRAYATTRCRACAMGVSCWLAGINVAAWTHHQSVPSVRFACSRSGSKLRFLIGPFFTAQAYSGRFARA